MKITLKLFVSLAEHLPAGACDNALIMEVEDELTPQALLADLEIPLDQAHICLLNGQYLEPQERGNVRLGEGDTLAIWPPVRG